jgi:Cu/Ag efflux protein CusF
MKFERITIVGLCLAVALAGCASSSEKAASMAPLPGGTLEEGAVTATATVKKIDHKTRKVTLQRADGSQVTFVAGDQVQNLSQVKAGDVVQATYYESIAFQVKKAGEGQVGAEVAEGMERAAPGEKPGAAGARVTTVTARIASIDKKQGTVTLEMPDGESTVVKARDPKNLERVAAGDLVDITLTEAVAIAVEPAAR